MDDLLEELAWNILERINTTSDKNSVSLTCKRLHEMENEQRKSIRVGRGMNPANEALISLCNRFRNLEKVEISYSGWVFNLGRQLDDEGLYNLSISCPRLVDLVLSYCTYITDAGLSHLSSCSRLSALKLVFTPKISGFGILSIAVGCKNLTVLHLICCFNINNMEWLEYLGKLETLEDLCIKNCRAITEGDLIKLGKGWRKLKRLQFEVDADYPYLMVYKFAAVDEQKQQWVSCDGMLELKLVNTIISPERGLACMLMKCRNLEKIHLDMCIGVKDSDMIGLARSSSNLRSISLRVPSDFLAPRLPSNPNRLTDKCLEALARNCANLESVRLSFSDGESQSIFSFTLPGILTLIEKCRLRELALDCVYSFNDVGMQALCAAECLETLELSRCQQITDEGLQLVWQYPQLRVLKLSKCWGVSDDGLKVLVGSHKLKVLVVEDCPHISERGIQGAADSVSFNQI